jgi:hypothetical protein
MSFTAIEFSAAMARRRRYERWRTRNISHGYDKGWKRGINGEQPIVAYGQTSPRWTSRGSTFPGWLMLDSRVVDLRMV